VVSWSILRRSIVSITKAHAHKDRKCSTYNYLPFATLFLDILNHEVKTIDEDIKIYLQQMLRKYYDNANELFNQKLTANKIGGKPPKIYDQFVVEVCRTCKKELFMHYYVSRGNHYCLECMDI
jgi:formamidopyrimidine-DNA glycosylase